MVWRWQYQDADGDPVEVPTDGLLDHFGTQADAETWLGDNWRDLVADGVAAVSLMDDDRQVYGPMSLSDIE